MGYVTYVQHLIFVLHSICSSNKQALSGYNFPGTISYAWNVSMNKANKDF